MGALDGRVALVTGGASGMGRETARAAAREGAAVAVVDRDLDAAAAVAAQLTAAGCPAKAFQVDVASEGDVEAAYSGTQMAFGVPDAIFNMAGIYETARITEMTFADYRRIMDVNAAGVWLSCRAAIRGLLEAGRPGTIVNVASVNVWYAEPQATVYSASKGAVYSLSKGLAFDHARDGIRVNCICPGNTLTGMTEQHYADQAVRAEAGSHHARGSIGLPDEIASVAVFLASAAASNVHGASVVVDGGMTIGRSPA